ncbi:MAG: hypothetical protein AMS23_00210 [Bacteroides sp. SM1_62]|nr:MAG: hypothetical protein AMS23_00210 [Bacteroides sp. SM1_62]
MKIKPFLFLLFSFILFASIYFLQQRKNPDLSKLQNTNQTLDQYLEQLHTNFANLNPHSLEAHKIARKMESIRAKISGKLNRSENPGAFLEALAAVKTAYDGRTYAPGYKIEELGKAQRFLKKPAMLLAWQERGPANVSGRARALIVDPDDPTHQTWYVGTVGGGIWKTNNAGRTWENKTPQLTTLSTVTMEMAQSNHDVIYAGTGMGYGRIVDLSGSGVWKSSDRGETWTQLTSTANGELLQAINRLVIDPENENIVVLCSNDGYSYLATKGGERKSAIFRTTDGGETWYKVYDPDLALGTKTDNRVQQIIANPENFNTLYATVNEVGVIKSKDAGKTWFISADNFALPEDIGMGGNSYQGISIRTEIAIALSDTLRLYAAVERRYGTADLYMTKDAGKTWILVEDTGNDPNWFSAYGFSGADGAYTAGWFDNTIAVHPYDKNVVFLGGVELYRSDINDVNYTRTTRLIGQHYTREPNVSWAHADHHFLVPIPVNKSSNEFYILNANDGGIAVSYDNGDNWQQVTGMVTTQFYGVDKKPGEDVYIGGMQDNGTYHSPQNPDERSRWYWDLSGDGIETVWNYRDPNLVLGSSQYNSLSKSEDGAITWKPVAGANAGFGPFLTKIANSKSDPDLVFIVGSEGISRSDDFGLSWTLTPIPGNWIGWRAFDNIEVSIADPQIVWISSRLTPDPYYNIRGGIYVSRDAGISFEEISQNFPNNLTESSGIATHPIDPQTAYFLFSAPDNPKIMRTRDLGQTWEDISGFGSGRPTSNNGFPDVAVFSLLVMPFDTDILWAGTEIGLFVSSDNGQSWHYADNGLATAGIFEMKIVDDQIVLATQGRGIWTLSLPELQNYTPPISTLSPRLNALVQMPAGYIPIKIDLRSAYDSTLVFLNGNIFTKLDANEVSSDTTLIYTVKQPETITLNVRAFKNERVYKSAVKSLVVFPTEIQEYYVSNLNTPDALNDFISDGFHIATPANFYSAAIHSDHPYRDSYDYILLLKNPVVISQSNAILSYKDIALVEPGEYGSQFGDANMWDFVVVEASHDGLLWLPISNGYDARADTIWQAIYDSRSNPDGSMFVTHSIDLLNTLSPGDTVFIRFRLYADSGVNGWGWVIDDIEIQKQNAGDNLLPDYYYLAQNYPNPFNSRTTITYALPERSQVNIKVYDILGQEIITLKNEVQDRGEDFVEWDGRNKNGKMVASGMYIYRLTAAGNNLSKKMILLR